MNIETNAQAAAQRRGLLLRWMSWKFGAAPTPDLLRADVGEVETHIRNTYGVDVTTMREEDLRADLEPPARGRGGRGAGKASPGTPPGLPDRPAPAPERPAAVPVLASDLVGPRDIHPSDPGSAGGIAEVLAALRALAADNADLRTRMDSLQAEVQALRDEVSAVAGRVGDVRHVLTDIETHPPATAAALGQQIRMLRVMAALVASDPAHGVAALTPLRAQILALAAAVAEQFVQDPDVRVLSGLPAGAAGQRGRQ